MAVHSGSFKTLDEVAFSLDISSDDARRVRDQLALCSDPLRLTALGVVHANDPALTDALERLVRLHHDTWRPGREAMPIAEVIKRASAHADPADIRAALIYAADLHLGFLPDRLEYRAGDRRFDTLGEALERAYPAQYQSHRVAQVRRAPRAEPLFRSRLRQLRLHNVQVFRDLMLDIGDAPLVLVGPNSVGKSTILNAIARFARAVERGAGDMLAGVGGFAALRSRGAEGPVSLDIGLEVTLAEEQRQARYGFTLDQLRTTAVVETERMELSGHNGAAPDVLIDGHRGVARVRTSSGDVREFFHAAAELQLPILVDEHTFPLQIQLRAALEQTVLVERDPWSRGDRPLAQNPNDLFLQIAANPEALAQFAEAAPALVPGIVAIEAHRAVHHVDPTISETLVVKERGFPGVAPISALSDGARQLLTLLALYCLPHPPRVILLEEPDASLYPAVLPTLRDLLRSLAEHSTVITTSHSPGFVGLMDPVNEVRALERTDAGTVVSTLAAALRSRTWLRGFGSNAEAFWRAAQERQS